MEYRVIHYFTDLLDDGYSYHTGDSFPRAGKVVSEERINELATANNKQRTPLIVLVKTLAEEPEKSDSPVGDLPETEEQKTPVKKPRKPRKKA